MVAARSGLTRANTLIGRRWGGGALQRPTAPELRRRQNPETESAAETAPASEAVTDAVSVAVAVSAAVAGTPAKPDRPALSRIRPTTFNVSDGQAGRPPLQCPRNRFETEEP